VESLSLDEGFSTLDSETLSKAADAIELLQGRQAVDRRHYTRSVRTFSRLADQMLELGRQALLIVLTRSRVH
jgi:hypothetical protein